MTDTKVLDKQAENYVKSQLSKFHIDFMEPSYDRCGSDLIIVQEINSQYSKTLIIQCKGRTLNKKGTFVEIPNKYVTPNFILFIYTVDNIKNENCYLFFPEDIMNCKLNSKNNYVIRLNPNGVLSTSFTRKIFNSVNAERLKELLRNTPIRKYTSIIIDATFLELAVARTIITYNEIWPKKRLTKPSLRKIIEQIITLYDEFKTGEKQIDCYVFFNGNLTYKYLDIDQQNGNNLDTCLKPKLNIVNVQANELESLEAIERMKRLINNENIILVANDRLYEHELNLHNENGVKVTVVKFSIEHGGDIFSSFKWGDIIYPIGLSLGLKQNEL